MDVLEDFAKKFDLIISAGQSLLAHMKVENKVEERNLIVYAFLRKTIRILACLKNLVITGFEEEAQIFGRVLIETRINFDYFLLLAKEDNKNATGRVIAALMLDKLKALNSTDFSIGDQKVDRHKWEQIENDIRKSCGDEVFDKLKKHGFSGMSLDARAAKTGNKQLYNLAYRLYSRNVHTTDIHEQLRDVWTTHNFAAHQETLLPAVLEASIDSGRAVVEGVNNWLGDPLRIS